MALSHTLTAAVLCGISLVSAVQACSPTHTVQAGDTLSKVAEDKLGSVFAFQSIYDVNRSVIGDNPNLIRIGMVLTIPCEPTADNPIDWSVMPSAITLASLSILTDIQILDIRAEAELADGLIPGSVSIPFDRWRGPESNPGQPPSEAELSTLIGDAGLRLEEPIIIVHDNPDMMDIGRAALVYWMLKSSGAETLAVLRDGFQSWEQAKLPITDAPITQPPLDVAILFSDEWRAHELDVYGIATNQIEGHLLDARPHSIFNRLDAVGNALATTLPGASNVPVDPLISILAGEVNVEDGVGHVLTHLDDHDIDWTAGPVVSFCHTGELAALNWFYASELAGLDNMVLYPESVYGWSQNGGDLFVGQSSPLEG